MASTTDEHREITNLLKSKGEEFYAVPALADRPLKVHRTGECPIKERLDTPHCINCDADGHTANWRSCPAFPKIKAKKQQPKIEIRVAPKYSLQKRQMRTSRTQMPLPTDGGTYREKRDFPGIIDAGKAFKNAKSSEDRLDIFFGVLASSSLSQHPIMIFSRFGLRIAAWNANGVRSPTIVVLTPPGENPLLIASIYIPPTTSPSACIHDLEKIFALEHSSILCGDYNAHHTHWGCNDNNPRGQLIKNLIDNTDTDIVAPNTPTRFGYNSASTIDFALTRNLYWVSDIVSSPELSSDHNPIILNFQTSIQFNFPTRNVSTNWERFRFHLADTPTFQPITAHSGEEIDEQVSTLTNQILTAYNNSSKQIHPNNNYYIDNDLRTLFKTRNRARKIYQYSRNPADKTTLNRIQNKIKRKIQAVTQKQWEDKLASLDTVDGSLWSTTKGFKKKRSPISALKGNTGIAYTDEEKAETLAKWLGNLLD
ncbi:probable RNA-directed DNA polymerase from transposon X-element [Trichonephila clavipes]|nr:probable RNA-directed DNA polymerase from transposon X-element [Trichonephila clavipes]